MKVLFFAVSFLIVINPAFAETVVTTAPSAEPVTGTPQVVVVQNPAPAQSVVVVNNSQPVSEDIYYMRRPRHPDYYIDGETAALIGTAAVIGGAAWGYHHHRRHHHNRRWY